MQHQLPALIAIDFDGDELPPNLTGLDYRLVALIDTASLNGEAAALLAVMRQAEGDALNLLFSWAIRLGICNEAAQLTLETFDPQPLLKLLARVLPDEFPEWVVKQFYDTEGLGKLKTFNKNAERKMHESVYQSVVRSLKAKVENAPDVAYDDEDLATLKDVGMNVVGTILMFIMADLSVLHPTLAYLFSKWNAAMNETQTESESEPEPVDLSA